MKGTEGHSVIVSELVVKVYESYSVGPYTKETNLPSCAAAPYRMGFVYLHGVRMKAHEGKSWWRGRRDSQIWAFGWRGRVFLACFYFWPLLFADFERAYEGKFVVSFVPFRHLRVREGT